MTNVRVLFACPYVATDGPPVGNLRISATSTVQYSIIVPKF